jgi:hypothetical protein
MNTSEFHITTLVAGLLFVILGGAFLLDAAGVWSVHPLIVGPVLLIGMGVAIIAGSIARGSTRKGGAQ